MSVKILRGDCRDVLRTLAANSVDCIVTSPPYWGLRDYGTAIWDGGDDACDHVTVNAQRTPWANSVPGPNGRNKNLEETHWKPKQTGGRCGKCGALRVDQQIGLEPTIAEYLKTMVRVCRELMRVLKPTGTFWLNVGSCYAGSGKGGNPPSSPYQKQQSNPGSLSVSGDRNPTRSRAFSRVRPCDSDGKEPPSFREIGYACCGRDGEDQDGSLSHHGRTPDNTQRMPQTGPHAAPIGQHSEHPACAPDHGPSFLMPTGLSSLRNALGASCREVPILAGPRERRKYSCDEIPKKVHVSDRTETSQKLASRMLDKDVSERACVCGSCGLCFVYLATGSLTIKPKDLLLVPDLLALALQADGWFLRSEIVWQKPNPMPESVLDRPSASHEKIWLLAKSARYFYDAAAIRNPPSDAFLQEVAEGYGGQDTKDFAGVGVQSASSTKSRVIAGARAKIDKQRGHGRRHAGFNDRWDKLTKEEQQLLGSNARNVWTIATKAFNDAHFATMPPALAERCIKAGCPAGGTVLDCFGGAGTTALVADRLGRNAISIELSEDFAAMSERRIAKDAGMFAEISGTACSEPFAPLINVPVPDR